MNYRSPREYENGVTAVHYTPIFRVGKDRTLAVANVALVVAVLPSPDGHTMIRRAETPHPDLGYESPSAPLIHVSM